ncbi:conserved hypothetical protein [Planktothrix sp. PCC 11201]|uniref:hypothetical protein n=1 Tax=Planktothrix sp. PCC 11201 TaxID=1729650 RepID=UPI00091452D1|nr:hypothetical protein [Planktothrix sp. PCC 11201]SKB14647.1 conserved hypothetical protein [Planktothrix sp. PCC 11201]
MESQDLAPLLKSVGFALDVATPFASAVPYLGTVLIIAKIGVRTYQGKVESDNLNRDLDYLKKGVDSLQEKASILESATATLGVGVALLGILSAQNLQQTRKLDQKLDRVQLELEKGITDLKLIINSQGDEILKTINQVGQEIQQEIHRVQFVNAYGIFQSVHNNRLPSALIIKNPTDRNDKLNFIWNDLQNCLAIYNNKELISCPSISGKLKRLECAWAIEQTLALIDILQNNFEACIFQLNHLREKIIKDCLYLTESCQSEAEIDFIFPRINSIINHDMLLIDFWKNNLKVIQNLSVEDQEKLANLDVTDIVSLNQSQESNALQKRSPFELYQELKAQSHFVALKDQLKFLIKPELRFEYESYISQRAIAINFQGIALTNWQEVPDLTVANLYYYFKAQEQK